MILLNTAVKNVVRRKNKSLLTVIITMIVVSIFVTFLSVIYTSYEGLKLSSERMGADILIYPDTAQADGTDIVFTGISEMVYMNEDEVMNAIPWELTRSVSAQFFLKTLPGAGCCDTNKTVRIVGVDSQNDFLLKSWTQKSDITALADDQIIIGSEISYETGDVMAVLNHQFTVADKLYQTGTGMDESIFVPINVLRKMAATNFPRSSFHDQDCNDVVSSIFVKLNENVTTDEFLSAFDTDGLGVTAETISSMRQSIAEKNRIIHFFLLTFGSVVIILAVLSLYIQFHSWIASRKHEVGYLKSIGFSTNEILRQFLTEIWMQCLVGSIPGVVVGLCSQNLIRGNLQKIFVMPSISLTISKVLLFSVLGILFSLLISGMTALPSAIAYSHAEPYKVISEGELR